MLSLTLVHSAHADEPLQPLPFGDHASVAYFEMHIEHAGDVEYVCKSITSNLTLS